MYCLKIQPHPCTLIESAYSKSVLRFKNSKKTMLSVYYQIFIISCWLMIQQNPQQKPTSAIAMKTSLFGELLGKSVTSLCSIDEIPSLMFSASTDAISSGGVLETHLIANGCSEGVLASIVGPNKTVTVNTNQTCRNDGASMLKHWTMSVFLLTWLNLIPWLHTKEMDHSLWKFKLQNLCWILPSSFKCCWISVSLGECGMDSDTAPFDIGYSAAVCISVDDNTVTLKLISVEANPGNQHLVNFNGVPNLITEVLNEGTNQMTLKSIMVPTYYNTQDGNAGFITMSGTTLINYTYCRLSYGRALGDSKESPFTFEIPLNQRMNPEVHQQKTGTKNCGNMI